MALYSSSLFVVRVLVYGKNCNCIPAKKIGREVVWPKLEHDAMQNYNVGH